jgi:hypothetical protein
MEALPVLVRLKAGWATELETRRGGEKSLPLPGIELRSSSPTSVDQLGEREGYERRFGAGYLLSFLISFCSRIFLMLKQVAN